MEVWLPPLQPHLFLLHLLFLSPPPSPNALVVLPPYRRLPTALLWSPSTQFSPESQKPFRRGVVNLDIYPVTLEPQCHQNHTEDLLKNKLLGPALRPSLLCGWSGVGQNVSFLTSS